MIESSFEYIVRQIVVWIVSIFLSIFIGLRLIFSWLRNPKLFDEKKFLRPKILDSWKQGSIHLKKVTISYVEAGDPQNQLMLMIHGFPEFWYSWRYQIDHFKENFHVVAVDMPGYGESSSPSGLENYKGGEIAKNMKDVIEELGHKEAIILSHDWGAVIAWRIAAEFPDNVSKLIIMNGPHPLAFSRFLRTNFSQMLKSWYIFFFQMPLLPELVLSSDYYASIRKSFRGSYGLYNKNNFTDEDEQAWLYNFSPKTRLTAPINYYRAAHQFHANSDLLEQPIVPRTLIIWGCKDGFLETKCADLSAEFCESAEIYYIKNGSHWIQQDFPEEVNKRIEEFIRQS